MGIHDIIHERLGVDIATFAGANVAGEVPLRDAFVNRLIAERLAGNGQIAALQVQTQDGDTMTALVVPRVRLLPPMRILAAVEQQPEFPQHPLLILKWTLPGAGALAIFAAPVLSFFKALPPGITMRGDRIAVDVAELLRSRGFDDVIGFIRRLSVHTRAGEFLVRFELGVDGSPGGEATMRRAEDPGGPEGPPLQPGTEGPT